MMESVTFEELSLRFKNCLIIFCSPHQSDAVDESVAQLKDCTFKAAFDEVLSDEIPESFSHSNNLRKSLPSFHFFKNIYTNFRANCKEKVANEKNKFFNPQLIERILINDLMPLCPLWTSALGPKKLQLVIAMWKITSTY